MTDLTPELRDKLQAMLANEDPRSWDNADFLATSIIDALREHQEVSQDEAEAILDEVRIWHDSN